MVTVYFDGKAVSWADAEQLFADAARTRAVEFRDAAGRVFATSVPGCEPVLASEETFIPDQPAYRSAEPGFTFGEMKKRLGWE